jgi:hypothetical protein
MALQSNMKYGDEIVYKRLQKGVVKSVDRALGGNFITELISGVLYFFVGLGALSVRVILRRKLGERSFGMFSVVLTYIFLKVIFFWSYVKIAPFEGSSSGAIGQILYETYALYVRAVGLFFPQWFPDVILNQEVVQNSISPFHFEDGNTFLGFFILTYLIFALIALGEVFYRILYKVRWYSYYRGKSSLFDWWLVGKKLGGRTITEKTVWLIIEPLFVAATSLIFYAQRDFLMGGVLLMGAICLLIEEFSYFRAERNALLDVMDGEFEAEWITKLKERHNLDREILYKDQSTPNENNSSVTI